MKEITLYRTGEGKPNQNYMVNLSRNDTGAQPAESVLYVSLSHSSVQQDIFYDPTELAVDLAYINHLLC